MTKEKLDLGKAFEKLKNDTRKRDLYKAFAEAEIYLKEKADDPYKYAFAYGVMSMAVKIFLFTSEERLGWDDFAPIKVAVAPNEKQEP